MQDADNNSEVVHYPLHQAVIRRDKKITKVRVVYDASARSDGPSLNACLHTGTKFNQKTGDSAQVSVLPNNLRC